MEKKRIGFVAGVAAASMLAGALLAARVPVGAQAPPFGPPPQGGPGMQGPGRPGMPGGPGMRFQMPPPQGMLTATEDHVYVLLGNTLYQFSAKDLKELHKVTLEPPQRPRPAGAPRGGAQGAPNVAEPQ